MEARTVRNWRLWPALVFALALAGGCTRPPDNAPAPAVSVPGNAAENGKKNQPKGPKKVTPVSPAANNVISLTEEQLAREYLAGPDAARKKYAGKVLEVRGVVRSANSNNFDQRPEVILQGCAEPGSACVVHCVFPRRDEKQVVRLVKGQAVKVRGTVAAEAGQGVLLADCKLAEVGKDPAVLATAARLARAFADGGEGREQYTDKPVVVEGVVSEVQGDGRNVCVFVLEGPGGNRVKSPAVEAHCPCALSKRLRAALAQVKKGQTIKVKGECRYEPAREAVVVSRGVLLD